MRLAGRILILVALAADLIAPTLRAETSNVRLLGDALRDRVSRAVTAASGRLARASCAEVLDEFHDAAGHSLRANLQASGAEAPEYLGRLLFYDGRGDGRCGEPGILAATEPGSHVVLICSSFFQAGFHDPALAETVVIHEALHTLGLGENPPSSQEINARILKRCH